MDDRPPQREVLLIEERLPPLGHREKIFVAARTWQSEGRTAKYAQLDAKVVAFDGDVTLAALC